MSSKEQMEMQRLLDGAKPPAGVDPEVAAEVRELLATGVQLKEWPSTQRARLWWKLEHRTSQRRARRTLGLSLAFGGALALSLFVIFPHHRPRATTGTTLAQADTAKAAISSGASSSTVREEMEAGPAGWSTVDLHGEGTLWIRPGSRLQLALPSELGVATTEPRVRLDSGAVCAHVRHRDLPNEGPFIVQTEGLRTIVIGTRFCVSVEDSVSRVDVQEGRVRVEGPSLGSGLVAFAEVGAGESIRSDSPKLARLNRGHPALAPSTVAAPAPVARTAQRPLASTAIAAPVDETDTDTIGAQNALYRAALERRDAGDSEGALASFREYQRIYPRGVLAPEVGLALIAELDRAGHAGDAAIAAAEQLRKYPNDPRASDVELKQAQLLASDLARPREALAAYQHVLTHAADPSQRGEALFGIGICQQALGRGDLARDSWRRYVADFPDGVHAVEATRLAGG